MYKFFNNADGELYSVMKLEDRTIIRLSDDNDSSDYQEYLEWVAEGNTPEPADS
tara:strand:+ start:365 stop:526 length:162 start_codon:yes stop_codon:yes gene_type:complete